LSRKMEIGKWKLGGGGTADGWARLQKADPSLRS